MRSILTHLIGILMNKKSRLFVAVDVTIVWLKTWAAKILLRLALQWEWNVWLHYLVKKLKIKLELLLFQIVL